VSDATPAKRVDVVKLVLVKDGAGFRYANRRVRTPGDAADLLRDRLQDLPREEFWIACLTVKNEVTCISMISAGDLSSSVVHPREVFKVAALANAASVILFHNHPSGDPTPSCEDLDVTKRLRQAGKLLGIPVLDHVVLGADGRYASLRELSDWNAAAMERLKRSNGEGTSIWKLSPPETFGVSSAAEDERGVRTRNPIVTTTERATMWSTPFECLRLGCDDSDTLCEES
jgi:DNA repair protein RadC